MTPQPPSESKKSNDACERCGHKGLEKLDHASNPFRLVWACPYCMNRQEPRDLKPEVKVSDTSERVGAVDGDAILKALDQRIDEVNKRAETSPNWQYLADFKDGILWFKRQLISGRFALKPEASQETKPPQTADEFRKRLLNDPIAYAYYNLGRAVERDIRLTPEQRKRKKWDAICAAVNLGYAEKILPDIWTAELEDAE